MKKCGGEDGYPQCVFWTHRYRYSVTVVECLMELTMNKRQLTRTGRSERVCIVKKHRKWTIELVFCCDKKTILESSDVEKKRLLQVV